MTITNSFKIRGFVLTIALCAGLGVVSQVSATVLHRVDLNTKEATRLRSFDPGYEIKAMNDAVQVVVSHTSDDGRQHSFITGPNGAGMTNLGGLIANYRFSVAEGINNAGQVVGVSETPNAGHAFITGPNGVGMTDLGTLAGDEDRSGAFGINTAGQVVGWSDIPRDMLRGDYHAFMTGPNGVGMTDLGCLAGNGCVWSHAHAINDAGQVVGWTDTSRGPHAFITGPNGVGMTDLGTVGADDRSSQAIGINNTGYVWGESSSRDGGSTHIFIIPPNGTDMTVLGDKQHIAIGDVNDAGQIVGTFLANRENPGREESHAFVTGPNGVGMTDLNLLVNIPGVILTTALQIDNAGQVIAITGTGVAPIPEPASYALMLAGLALVGFMANRNRS